MTMENWDDLELLQELSDPNFAIFAAQIEEYNVNRNSNTSYDVKMSDDDENDPYVAYVAPTRPYNAAGPMTENEVPLRRHLAVTTPARPILDTHQSAAYTPSHGEGYGYMQNPTLTISPTEFDGDSKIIITPPQGYCTTFESSFGDHMQLKTPSLDSGTTYATQYGTCNDIQSGPEQDLSWLAFPPSTSGNLSSTLDPTQYQGHAGSKRSSIDLGIEEEEGRPKRARSVKNGYECEHDTCDRRFNRACDERKHFKNVHGNKAHKCGHCNSRFPYPKDVRRHMKQVHHIDVPAANHDEGKVKPSRRFSSLKSVVSMLANLQLWSKDDHAEEEENAENFILVTQNHRDFRKIYLEGLESSEALMAAIGNAFGVHLGHIDEALLRRCVSGGRLGKRVVGPQLMAAVGKAVAAGKTLELFFTPRDDGRGGS